MAKLSYTTRASPGLCRLWLVSEKLATTLTKPPGTRRIIAPYILTNLPGEETSAAGRETLKAIPNQVRIVERLYINGVPALTL